MKQRGDQPPETYNRFVSQVRKQEEVYGLQAPDGAWAVCSSLEQEDADVVLVWSDRELAIQQQKEDWQDYIVTPIPLDEFINAWLKGMHEDGSIVGPDWRVDLSGPEVEPIELARHLTPRLDR